VIPERRPRTLQLRLVAAFVGVAAVAIGIFAGLTLWAGRGQVDDLVRRQQQAVAADTAAALADAYQGAGGWEAADPRAARAVAASGGAVLEVQDSTGATVFRSGAGLGAGAGMGMGRGQPQGEALDSAYGAPLAAPVVVAGEQVGTALLRFPRNALPPAERQLRDALTRTTVLGVLIAVAAALLVGLVVALGITRPLRRLIDAVRRLGAGDRSARANLAAPGELGELAAAVDRMAANLEREDELRRLLTADVAHELRTPVTILAGHCEAMLDGVAEPSREHVASLYEEVLRLNRVIEDLEALASAEAAGLRLERSRIGLADVVRGALDLLAPQFEAAEIALDARLDPEVAVDGDATRLGQVVRNLLANALKFTPAGGRVAVEVSAGPEGAVLAVRDTGPGIPEDELPRVFDRFWRGRRAGGTPGSGIGLAVVDELVRAHGGSVEVGNAEGGGTVFGVTLPLAAAPDAQPLPA
jgi:two-component system sensor histidine kinase BaeS